MKESTKKRPTLAERFWAKVEKTDTCWLWTGAKRFYGYGVIVVHGRLECAHRVSLGLHGIEIPAGKVVDHICKVTACVRPEHLRFVTQTENVTVYADRSKKSERLKAAWAAKRA